MQDTVIVAEDSPPNRKILAHLLKKFGFNVIACENGQQAWDFLQGNPDTKVAAVISDIMMPTMDGLALLQAIRESQHFATLPVLLITALSDNDYIEKAKALKANGYILKPVTYERVLATLKDLFPQMQFPKLSA